MTITPSPLNLRIGAGNVFIGAWTKDDDDILRFDGRHAGNVESCTIANDVTKVEKKSAMEGARGLYGSAVVGVAGKLNLVMDEFDLENVGIALLGTPKAFTQDAITATARDLNNGDAIELDHWYDLGGFNADVTGVDQGGALEAGADYEVNKPAGLIRILSAGAGTAAATTWTGTVPGLEGSQVSGLDTPTIVKAIRIVDAVDMVSGIKGVLDVWRVQMTPNGDNELISEEYGKLTIQGDILIDTTRPVGDRYYRWLPLSELTAVEGS